ncbi:UDP-glucose/GDP-mannose dehydrogenase family protein [Hydrogenimonas thermophila]|uniref:UDP-glucose dehydrogenase family protein n=1 Tax=Hydrogenimonas thermophila TaxID=223786 RepID=UPI002936FE8D|nr:UDP-glucose/GDP-mannose dehydrogenase family protein [Hydrogenimonas thermophila]WOE69028.1 UDP-glucose/GDP-mannose dehydrogenase family protein [Hydrogenimonas thermophila]WOE71538.1 UDP-glucose/GDP-mannose dehydrogenase family protein [Hydrogenimonas thermophila]
MKLSIVGTGYVGLVTGTCFAEMGNSVICVDIDENKIEKLKQGIIPIYEPGLETMVKENYKKGTLQFTTDIKEALEKSDVIFIAVGTPQGEDGSADLQYVLKVAEDIGKYMTHKMIVVDKSTVPVGTADKVKETIQKELDKRGVNIPFEVVSNPEFLKEGSAIEDFMKPDRVVIGAENEDTLEVMKELYAPFTHNHERFIAMDVRSAEMTKYTANAILATKISFMNEIANICERVGADVNKVRIGIGSDKRIGYSFIYPGCGYGGSCFPKDVQALNKIALDAGYKPRIIQAVEEVNKDQKRVLAEKVIKRFGEDLNGKTFAIWGLSFKPETDDMREASSITIINELTKRGAKIKAYDPKAMDEAKEFYLKDNPNVEYTQSKYDVLNGADAMLLVTEWKEFRSPDFDEMKQRLKNPIIFDGRNQYNIEKMNKKGFEYYQIGVQERNKEII